MKLNGARGSTMPASNADTVHSEADRLRILESYGLDELEDDPELAEIASFAAKLCDTPVAMVSLVEKARQRFLVREGLEERETPRELSFCAHAMLNDQAMVVPDATQDDRFSDNPLVTGDTNIRFYAGQPLHSIEGAPLGSLCVIDHEPREGLTEFQQEGLKVLSTAVVRRLASRRERLGAEAALAGSREHTLDMLNEISQIAFSINREGVFDFYNRQFFNFTAADAPIDAEAWRPLVHPDDVDGVFKRWYSAAERGEPYIDEFRLRYRDESWRWVQTRTNPVGKIKDGATNWFGTMTDVDDSHRISDNRDVLARELSHRIKNIFAVVSGLISLRARGKPEVREFAEELKDTVLALGRAHDYVRPMEGRKGDSLRGLLEDLLAPYRDLSGDGISLTGADLPIGPRAATPLALVFHELATNSAKYGALGTDDGEVSVTISPPDPNGSVTIEWRERTKIEAEHAKREGFGSRLVKLAVEGQLGGAIERHFDDQGLRVVLAVSSEAIAS